MILGKSRVAGFVLAFAATQGLAAPPTTTPNWTPNQTVEVREGDVWSKVTIVAKEGRRIQIRYEDGTEEWVTADRLRLPGTKPDEPSPTPAVPAVPKKIVWQLNQKVEVKWGGLWSQATIVNRRGEWLLVKYNRGDQREWVEPWRIRKIGDTTDVPYATPNPPVWKQEGPPRPSPGEAPEVSAREKPDDAFAPEAFDLPIAALDDRDVVLTSFPEKATWTYTPGAATFKPVTLVPKGPLQRGADVSGVGMVDGNVLIGYRLSSGDAKGSSVEWFDASNRRQVQIKLDKATEPLDLLGADTVLARAAGFFGGTKHRVDVWKLSERSAEQVVSFIPYPKPDGKADDVDTLLPVDATHVLTAHGNDVTVWSIPDVHAAWRVRGKGDLVAAISPDRKSVAVAEAGRLLLLDALTGRVQGLVNVPEVRASSWAFSPSGKRLFGNVDGSLGVVDLEKGTWLTSLATGTPVQSVLPLSDRLVDIGTCVLDVNGRCAVAKLDRPSEARSEGGLLAVSNDARAFYAVSLPIPALEVLPAATNGGDVLDLSAGTSIALDVSLDSPQAQEVIDELRASLTRHGLKVSDTAKLRLIARTENGKSEERTYESMHGPIFDRDREKVTVTEKITRVWLELDGRTVWERRVSYWPSTFVNRKQGQSIADAVAASSQFDVDFLRTLELPAAIIQTDRAKLPVKTLTAGGVK